MKQTILLVSVIWTAFVSASFWWNYSNASYNQNTLAIQTARSFFNQIVITRRWNSGHGGVYVPVTQNTQPNPYLEDPLRDLTISDTLKLTKINPAFMTRQIAEIADQQVGVRFHITSLKPIRPANAPTPREQKALQAFEAGVPEFSEAVITDTNKSFFYMAPLKTEKSCLQCHAKQGYREGDIRGGISVTLPFVPEVPIMALGSGHLAIWLFGILGIVVFGVKLNGAYEQIRKQAVIDALTGIPNRRSFTERILAEYGRSVREKNTLAVILGDIDYFKLYNDTYGHTEGDECLRKVAGAIQNSLKRASDFCARYGGEEFVIVLPNTGLEGAATIAEEIRENVQAMKIPHEKSSPLEIVTISLGVAVTNTDVTLSHEELIRLADKALYAAKEKGRNCVQVSNEVA